ncbi:DNA-directed RNA polymerase II subunit rpb4 [Pseudocercospora fuligena]|uniref:DNA-directed RNA polymerase II subunit rpb4 n=1 Tax=Pseudocercospora fuligena TaxID=685502 RepID=A0A8H6VFI8_9PEZI|nr:DNA-directed RNA polymerase II subunit rpb4 [Pseudocercospora fuligena]
MAGPSAASTLPQQTSRRRPPPTGDEEASQQLKLGNMTHEQALSPAEVTLMLERLEDAAPHKNHTEVYYKTREYCKTFSRFRDEQAIGQVNQITSNLTARGLGIVEFERCQLATLCCDSVEEARTLIPSLEGKISDEELENTLNEISKLRDFS